MQRFIVETLFLSGWENCWTVDSKPSTFATEAEAEAEILDHIADVQEAIDAGDMEGPAPSREEFRIVPAPLYYTCGNCDHTTDSPAVMHSFADWAASQNPCRPVLLPVGECPECLAPIYHPEAENAADNAEKVLDAFEEFLTNDMNGLTAFERESIESGSPYGDALAVFPEERRARILNPEY